MLNWIDEAVNGAVCSFRKMEVMPIATTASDVKVSNIKRWIIPCKCVFACKTFAFHACIFELSSSSGLLWLAHVSIRA